LDLKRSINKSSIIFVAVTILIIWNIGSFYLTAQKSETSLTPSNTAISETGIQTPSLQQIDPPLGTAAKLPNATTYFNLLLFNLPIEITVVFLAEFFIGAMMKTDKKRSTFLRLLLMLGVASLLTVASSLVHYLLVWPAMHDMPIHYPDTEFEYNPAETFYSPAVDIILFITAAIIVISLHFPVFKFLLGHKYSASGFGLIIPALYFFIVWYTLTKQKIPTGFWDKTQQTFYLNIIFAGGFIFITTLVLIWNLTLSSGKKIKKRPLSAGETYTEKLLNK